MIKPASLNLTPYPAEPLRIEAITATTSRIVYPGLEVELPTRKLADYLAEDERLRRLWLNERSKALRLPRPR